MLRFVSLYINLIIILPNAIVLRSDCMGRFWDVDGGQPARLDGTTYPGNPFFIAML